MIHRIRKIRHAITFVMLIVFIMAVWLVGPLWVVANQYPLQQPEKRLYIIAILVVAWIISIFTKQEQKNASPQPKSPDAQVKLETLKGRFAGAIQFLKKTVINHPDRSVSLLQLPWYLLIGPSGAGKTTLLANSNINFILTKQFKQEKIIPSETCDWWVTRDLVLVDIPGWFLKEKYHFLWDTFLSLIKKNTSIAQKPKAVIIALQLPELVKQQNLQQKKQIIAEVKQKLLQLQEQFGNQLAIYVIITKCDLLPGFSEFFSECGSEELSQAWGITLPSYKENGTIIDIFVQRFNALIKRLNKQLIWRLHQERNPVSRPSIKDFPLQVERLKESLTNFLKALSITDLNLQGVYLTSALQPNNDDNSAQANTINPATQQIAQLLRTPAMPSKPYFIRQVILQGLLCTSDYTPPPPVYKKTWHRKVTYAISIITIVTSALILGHDFQQSVLQTYAIQNNLAQYQLAIQQSNQEDLLIKALPLLNTLQAAATRSNNNLSQFSNLLSFYSDKSQKTASKVYLQALQTIVLPAIKNYFENYLKNSNKNSEQLYAVLKAYLMLGDAQYFQTDYQVKVLKQLLPNSFSKKTDNDLLNHIRAAFNKSQHTFELNKPLVSEVRNKLTSLSNQELAWVILKNMNNNNSDTPIYFEGEQRNMPVFVNKQMTNQIPSLYTSKTFPNIYSQEIVIAATEALQGNWVLGNPDVLANEATITALVEQVRAQYIRNYVDSWESLLANLKIITTTSLTQTDTMIANLTSNASPLLQLLQTIKENTSFEPITLSSPKILTLNNLLANANTNQENNLYHLFVTLRQLHTYLQGILNTKDIANSAFEAAKIRMQNSSSDPITQVHLLAEQNPEPIKTWLHELANQSWYGILQEASHYIETAWQVNIITIYHSQIANRFPFNEDSNEELDVQQFANFTGKGGIFANFYQRFLRPFVNDEGKKWQWRVVDNEKLPFSNKILEELQEAAKLQSVSKYTLYTQSRTNPILQRFQLPEKLTEQS